MSKKELSNEVQVAQMQVAHERKVMDAFMECPSENVASVTLEVSGIEHTILIHDEDYPQLYALLCKLNDSENVRLAKLLNEMKNNQKLMENVLDVVEKKQKRDCIMKLETMKQICSLFKCNVTESDTSITFNPTLTL